MCFNCSHSQHMIIDNKTSSWGRSIFGIPLLTGKRRPVSGQTRAPSSRWSSKRAWWNLFRNSSEFSMEESAFSGSSVYPMARDASTRAFQWTFWNIFFRNSLFISTIFSATFSASMRSGNPFTTPFMFDDSMLCVSSLIFTNNSPPLQT